jgi:hypothetical protein
MLTLYSYPELFGVADNNGYGLKVFAFLKLAGLPFTDQQSSTLLHAAKQFVVAHRNLVRHCTAIHAAIA